MTKKKKERKKREKECVREEIKYICKMRKIYEREN
jgi:hypothetical protein